MSTALVYSPHFSTISDDRPPPYYIDTSHDRSDDGVEAVAIKRLGVPVTNDRLPPLPRGWGWKEIRADELNPKAKFPNPDLVRSIVAPSQTTHAPPAEVVSSLKPHKQQYVLDLSGETDTDHLVSVANSLDKCVSGLLLQGNGLCGIAEFVAKLPISIRTLDLRDNPLSETDLAALRTWENKIPALAPYRAVLHEKLVR